MCDLSQPMRGLEKRCSLSVGIAWLRKMEPWGSHFTCHHWRRDCREGSPQGGRNRAMAWSPDLMARSEHLDTDIPEGTPWIFQLHVPVYSLFCISQSGLNFCWNPCWTNSYPLRLSSRITSSPKPHQLPLHHWWPECSSYALLWLPYV